MLSDWVVGQHKFVLIVDNLGIEKYSDQFIKSWLREKNVHNVTNYVIDQDSSSIGSVINDSKSNIILGPLSNLLLDYKPSLVFQEIHLLKKSTNISQIFLWATKRNIEETFIIPFLEYMANLIVTIEDTENLSIITRKSGGSVTNKHFTYELTKECFNIQVSAPAKKVDTTSSSSKPQNLSETFKIELNEDELIARNAVKLPYERNSNNTEISVGESQIIYTPDSSDDFDDEDPDDDLYI